MHTGRHFLQIPGPTNVPDRVLRAMAQPVIDHRGPEFAELSKEVLHGVRRVFQTTGPVVIFPSEPADRVGRDDLLQQDAAIGGLGSYPVAATRLGSRVRSSLPP